MRIGRIAAALLILWIVLSVGLFGLFAWQYATGNTEVGHALPGLSLLTLYGSVPLLILTLVLTICRGLRRWECMVCVSIAVLGMLLMPALYLLEAMMR